MKTTIFVPVLTSDAKWIFCNAEEAFDIGLTNGEGKMIRGYHSAEDAIASYKENQPQEAFAVLHLTIGNDMQHGLAYHGGINGTGTDKQGRRLWTVSRDASNFIFAQGKYKLLMEIVPVEHTGISLY
jgi:hypothetical protein